MDGNAVKIVIRLTEDQRDMIETAARVKGPEPHCWALENLMDDAKREITESRTLRLTDEAYGRFVSAPDDPTPPVTDRNRPARYRG